MNVSVTFSDENQQIQLCDEKDGVLQPLAMVAMGHGNNCDKVSNLESVAKQSNGQLVYALDDEGKQVAVGLIVPLPEPNEVDISSCEPESFLKENVEVNSSWVGAVEECVTADEFKENEVKVEPQKSEVIRVYKVNKGKASKKASKSKVSECKRKTLKEMKLHHSFGDSAVKMSPKSKPKRYRRLSKDRTFPMPASVRHADLPSKQNTVYNKFKLQITMFIL